MTISVNFVPGSKPELNEPGSESEDGSIPEGNKVIFLDLEGVLVSHKTIIAVGLGATDTSDEDFDECRYLGDYGPDAQAHWPKFVDLHAFGLILRVCQTQGAKIVITSTLRQADWILTELKDLAQALLRRNAEEFFHSDWRTRRLYHREEEIQDWLDSHSNENITHWAAVDDRKLQLPKHMCLVRATDGFSYQDFITLEMMLTDKPIKPNAVFL